MIKFNFGRGAAIAALALTAALLGSSPSMAKTEDLGQRATKVDSGDQQTGKEAIAVSAPTAGTPAVAVKETVHYIHKGFWWWSADQIYTIQVNGSAEFVDRLDYWMLKDADGSLYRFNKGSNVGIVTAKPTLDIGARSSVMSASDSGFVSAVTAGAVSSDGSRALNVASKYTHVETYDNVTYSVDSTVSATFVELQNAHMAWIGGTLYRVSQTGNVETLRAKPVVNVGVRDSQFSANDSFESSSVSAAQVSFNGRTRALVVSRDYTHEENFQRLRYSIQNTETATFVAEQNSYLAWINNNLYRVRVGSDDVVLLSSKPVVSVGFQLWKLDFSDQLSSVNVIPVSLTNDSKSIVVNVRRFYRHNETFQSKEYFVQSDDIARYNDTYRVWTVIVDGRIYAIAFDGDVVNDGSVVVVQDPSGLHRPDVIVVSPNGEDPPVVVPTKKRPPVVTNDNDDPPVVVPGKRKPPVVIDNDDDGPRVVVPRH